MSRFEWASPLFLRCIFSRLGAMHGITSRVLIAHVLVAIPILKWLRLLGPDYANYLAS